MIYSSTFFVIFALFKFFKASREIEKWNTNVCFNKRSLVLHLLLLIFITVVSSIIPYVPYLYNRYDLFYTVVTITDTMYQLTICYICLTMTSNSQISKFKVSLDVSEGFVRLRLSRKESIVESEFSEAHEKESGRSMIS